VKKGGERKVKGGGGGRENERAVRLPRKWGEKRGEGEGRRGGRGGKGAGVGGVAGGGREETE